MKTKSKKAVTVVIILLVLIAVICAVIIVGNKQKTNNTDETATETTITTETTAEQTTEFSSDEIFKYYGEIITQCENAAENNFYKDYSDEEAEKAKGKYLPSYTLNAIIDGYAEPKIYYTFHDIDKNGIPEMFLAIKNDKGYDFQDMFTYADGKIYPLFDEYFGMSYHDVLSNGIITGYGSDGECDYYNFWHIAKDGHTMIRLDTLNNYFAGEKNKYTRELVDNDNMSSAPSSIEISREEFDLIGKIYTGQKLRPFDECKYSRSDINFEWKVIE